MPIPVAAWLARMSLEGRARRVIGPIADTLLDREFSSNAVRRVQIYGARSRICFSQIYPVLRLAPEAKLRAGIEIRYTDIDQLRQAVRPPRTADVVLIQPWFTMPPGEFVNLLAQIRAANPDATLIFLDSYAHNDLRFARYIDPYIDRYVKKSLFRDRRRYLQGTFGDTNLTDHFGRLYGCPQPRVDWRVPETILAKLHLGPGFFTAPGLLDGFFGAPPAFSASRPIDLQARLGTEGSGWYKAMRSDALGRAARLPGRLALGAGLSRRQFLAELRATKMVFSPFGYGELCWRDIEGFLTGSVVIKQDMGHLETRPDLFKPWVTYAPVAWDFSDLAETYARLQDSPGLRAQIAENAWQTVRQYLEHALVPDLLGMLSALPVARPTRPALRTAAEPAPAA